MEEHLENVNKMSLYKILSLWKKMCLFLSNTNLKQHNCSSLEEEFDATDKESKTRFYQNVVYGQCKECQRGFKVLVFEVSVPLARLYMGNAGLRCSVSV